MRNAGLEEAQAGIKTAARNIDNFRYEDDTTLMAESEEELQSLLMKVKEESEKAGLKLNIQKTKIMASGLITSWEIDGETVETVADFVFLGSKIAGRNINNLRYADDTTLMAESEEELKSFLVKMKEESEKIGLKLNIQKTKIMASSPITSSPIDGETVKTVADFIFLGSKITADGDCRHEIERRLLVGRKVMTNLDSIFKGRDITLSIKVCLVKAMVFPVVMYECESWTVKKAEHRRIDAFELWCWRRL